MVVASISSATTGTVPGGSGTSCHAGDHMASVATARRAYSIALDFGPGSLAFWPFAVRFLGLDAPDPSVGMDQPRRPVAARHRSRPVSTSASIHWPRLADLGHGQSAGLATGALESGCVVALGGITQGALGRMVERLPVELADSGGN